MYRTLRSFALEWIMDSTGDILKVGHGGGIWKWWMIGDGGGGGGARMRVKFGDAKDPSNYLPLYRAALKVDWETSERFFKENPDAVSAKIATTQETALHVAATTGKGAHFVEKLVELMRPDELALRDHNGDTALNLAAVSGDVKVAKILVNKNPFLPYMEDNRGVFPVQKAAQNAQRDMVLYLLSVTSENAKPNPYADHSGVLLLVNVIDSGLLDVALDLVERFPHMAQSKLGSGRFALLAIAKKAAAFQSGNALSLWKRLIYTTLPLKLENHLRDNREGDIEDPADCIIEMEMYSPLRLLGRKYSIAVCQKLYAMLWRVIGVLAPCIMQIQHKKMMHYQAVQLVRCLCQKILSLNNAEAYSSFYILPVLAAARLNIPEVVEEIVEAFPTAVWCFNGSRQALFQVAVIHRSEKVFNLIYQMSEHKWRIMQRVDNDNNNILHLAGKLAPFHKLSLVPGPALQMQREIQWFKEVEKWVRPQYIVKENKAKETPAMVFAREHKDLSSKGEEWMKGMAESCMIVGALITTVIFAAAITVPGGDKQETGVPIFYHDVAFMIFAISNGISLFTSTSSVFMFLSILTSRYAEEDFLHTLPRRLIIGLVTLFFSIISMMVAFSSTIYLIFAKQKGWALIPVATLACLPVTVFVSFHFPLLLDVISSTFGRGIFGKESDRLFY